MKKNNLNIILITIIILSASGISIAQEIKPMAPSIDITGQRIDFESANKTKSDEIKQSPDSFQSDTKIQNNNRISEESNINENERQKQDEISNTEKSKKEKKKVKEKESEILNKQQIVQQDQKGIESTKNDSEETAVIPAKPVQKPQITNVHDSEIIKQAEVVELELRMEEPKVLRDLRTLWSAAVEKSTTIRLAIQKLSNPEDGTKEDQGMMSKFLSPLASIAPLAAMASSSATQTAGALLGGSMLDTLTSDVDSQYNRAFIRITDYDLIMLAKSVDELQSKLVIAYYEYIQSIERLNDVDKAIKNCQELLQKAEKTDNFAAITAANAFYREAVQTQLNAKQSYLKARTELEQITGNDAIVYIETVTEDSSEQPVGDEKPQGSDLSLPAKKDLTQQTPLMDKSNPLETLNESINIRDNNILLEDNS